MIKRLFATGLFAGAALSACSDAGTPESATAIEDGPVAEAAHEVRTNCKYLDPAFFPPLPIPVNVNRELILRDLGVVEEPCHTQWGTCGPPNEGIWTFAGLMTRIAGAVPVQQFVANWLHQWEVGVVVNGFFVPPRPSFRSNFLGPWLVASGCAAADPIVGGGACLLDLKKAPFRLLAIVNRVDNATFTAGAPPVHDAEARFVFGMLGAGGVALKATTIFEFKLPPTRGGAPYGVFDWATAWHGLSNPALGPMNSPGYLGPLTAILNDVTMPGVYAGRPNNSSAIGQVRTNEVDFGPAGPGQPWKLREFHLTDVGAGINNHELLMAPTNQTPDDSRFLSPQLDTYLFNNSLAHAPPVAALSTFTHTVNPLALPLLPGGESTAPFTWNHSVAATLTPLERGNFGFATCNGCHTTETNTAFTHISPRPAGGVAGLSPFLSTSTVPGAAGFPAFDHPVLDPAGSGVTFRFNEPWRRICEVNAILDGAPVPYTRGNGMF